jgi:hypothetical protein
MPKSQHASLQTMIREMPPAKGFFSSSSVSKHHAGPARNGHCKRREKNAESPL